MFVCLVFIFYFNICVRLGIIEKCFAICLSFFFWETLYLLAFLIRMDMASLPLTRFWPRINTPSLTYFMNKLIHFPHELLTIFLLVPDHVDLTPYFIHTRTHTRVLSYSFIGSSYYYSSKIMIETTLIMIILQTI